ncbi:MAG: hypothetical protein QXV58_14560 [Saccharolobus sp.]|uniref:hypothetical protein n=1 Tax=Saccharolobus sp. TaxID=2100761 RepID=UPI0031632E01
MVRERVYYLSAYLDRETRKKIEVLRLRQRASYQRLLRMAIQKALSDQTFYDKVAQKLEQYYTNIKYYSRGKIKVVVEVLDDDFKGLAKLTEMIMKVPDLIFFERRFRALLITTLLEEYVKEEYDKEVSSL